MLIFLAKYYKVILLVLFIGTSNILSYNYGNNMAEIAQYKKVKDSIISIEKTLDSVASGNEVATGKLNKDISEILTRVKQKPVTIIKNGKCVPATEFVDSLNEAINRANSK